MSRAGPDRVLEELIGEDRVGGKRGLCINDRAVGSRLNDAAKGPRRCCGHEGLGCAPRAPAVPHRLSTRIEQACLEVLKKLSDTLQPVINAVYLSLTLAGRSELSSQIRNVAESDDWKGRKTSYWGGRTYYCVDRRMRVRFALGCGLAWVHGILAWTQCEQGLILSQRIYSFRH